MINKKILLVIPKVALAIVIAFAILSLFYFLSPKPLSNDDLVVSKGKWTNLESGKTHDVIVGQELAPQIPKDEPCCKGYYEFLVPEYEKVVSGRALPALYISAASCSSAIAINGNSVPLTSSEYTSVGPIIPLPTSRDQYPMTIRIDTECPRFMTSGIWKRPIRIGEFLDLVTFQSAERNFQIVTPLVSGAIFAAMGIGFIAIYFLTDRRFSFYLDVSFGLISWSVFLVFLSGVVRESNFWLGAAIHLPVRVLAACGAYFVVRAYLKVITGNEEKDGSKTRIVLLGYVVLSLLCLYFSITGQNHYMGITTMIASACAYILILRWPLHSLKLGSIGFIAFVVCLTNFIGAISDGIKIVTNGYSLPYFNRYTANLFMTTAVVLFMRQFVGLYRNLQEESLRAARATATGRAVRMIAHDVRAPFTSLRMGLMLLGKARGDQNRIDDLLSRLELHLNQNFDRVNRMLKDVMNFGGELRIESSHITLQELTDATAAAVPRSDSQKILLEISEGHTNLEVDRDKIIRALANILENALQAATPETSVTFKVAPFKKVRVAGVLFSIHNFGKHIASEKLEKIFSEFFTEGKVGGTGLGLAIAKEFVEGHGGTIQCVSDVKLGTEFMVWLPLVFSSRSS